MATHVVDIFNFAHCSLPPIRLPRILRSHQKAASELCAGFHRPRSARACLASPPAKRSRSFRLHSCQALALAPPQEARALKMAVYIMLATQIFLYLIVALAEASAHTTAAHTAITRIAHSSICLFIKCCWVRLR